LSQLHVASQDLTLRFSIWVPPVRVDRLDPFFIEIGALEDCAEIIV
jgi:hypothetical protein